MHGHTRVKCRRPIRCLACLGWGHVVASCRLQQPIQVRPSGQQSSAVLAKAKIVPQLGGDLFKSTTLDRPSSSRPPRFNSFLFRFPDIFAFRSRFGPPFNPKAHYHSLAQNLGGICSEGFWRFVLSLGSCSLVSSPSLRPLPSEAAAALGNPLLQVHPLPSNPSPLQASAMAFQRADPTPFIPEGLVHDDIPNRVFMV